MSKIGMSMDVKAYLAGFDKAEKIARGMAGDEKYHCFRCGGEFLLRIADGEDYEEKKRENNGGGGAEKFLFLNDSTYLPRVLVAITPSSAHLTPTSAFSLMLFPHPKMLEPIHSAFLHTPAPVPSLVSSPPVLNIF